MNLTQFQKLFSSIKQRLSENIKDILTHTYNRYSVYLPHKYFSRDGMFRKYQKYFNKKLTVYKTRIRIQIIRNMKYREFFDIL